MQFEAVIGLEVHAQLKTRTKIFCSCSTRFGAPSNAHTCPVCLGMPGVLPVLNKKVVDYTITMALATNCRINPRSRFARKNYFYPDLPKGYQISQYELPIAEHGHLYVERDEGRIRVGITRIHMEEDAGKLMHDPDRPISRVDLNRTGVPLMEIVSEPDIRTPEQAGAYLRQLRTIVRYLDICDGNMEEGSFRCDANVSIRPKGEQSLGTRTEIKNLNSFRHVENALRYEIIRQQEVVAEGQAVIQETRLWNERHNRTTSMRGKEEAHDYRYFPDPDLLPLLIDEQWIANIKNSLPELPEAKRQRFVTELGLPAYDAQLLTSSRELADYYEQCLSLFPHPKTVSNWVMGNLLAFLKQTGKPITESPIKPVDLARLLSLVEEGRISTKIAKTVFEEMAASGKTPKEIVAEKGLSQVTDESALAAAIDQVLERSENEVAAYRNGKTKLMGFFVGQVMKATGGKANPKIVNQILRQKLEPET